MSFIKGVVLKTSAPTVNDDNTKGFYEGFSWVDTSTDTTYKCVDDSTGAAVWNITSSPTGGITGKWSAAFNSANVGTTTYLRRQNGTPSNLSPYVVPVDMTITMVTASSNVAQTWTMTVRKDTGGGYSTIHTISSGGAKQKIDTGLSIDVDAGDRIAMRMETGTSIDYPNVDVYFKER